MKEMNESYNLFCEPGYKSYKKITNYITLIDNFFKNFEEAKNFFTSREKWKCISYQNHSKPGYESLFPSWVGKSLMEKYILDNKICDDMNSYKTICNFFGGQSNLIWSIFNSNYFPHFDVMEFNGISTQICLINMNKIPVSTKFYTFKNKEYCSINNYNEWIKYVNEVEKKLFKYYNGNKSTITRDMFKEFLEHLDKKEGLEIKLIKTVEYNPNQAIIYPANLFHSPNVTSEFSEKNPRTLLRTSFDIKI